VPFPDEAFASRVEMSAYRDSWATEAAAYAVLLRRALPDSVAVDHIGSTSVPGLVAKDCLDLMVQVEELHEESVIGALAERGFRARPEPWNHDEVTDGVGHRKLVFAGPAGERLVNVHVRVAGGRNVRYALLFRDFLRAHAEEARRYEQMKTRLSDAVTDLGEYGQIKAAAQPLLMREAERWAVETGWSVAQTSWPSRVPVLGVDGCRAGWVGVLAAGTCQVLVARSIVELVDSALERARGLAVVAVDIPIGLPDRGRRHADLLARRRLPVGRKSSVFPTPTRSTTCEPTYAAATAVSRATTRGKGISQQTFRIVPKILEVDAFVRAGPSVSVIESHPEVTFVELDPGCVVARKTTVEGSAARRAALRSVGLVPPTYVQGQGYAADDLLDACALAWTAARYAEGSAYSLPPEPEVFSDGIPAAIWV